MYLVFCGPLCAKYLVCYFLGLLETGLHLSACNFQPFVVQRHTILLCTLPFTAPFSLFPCHLSFLIQICHSQWYCCFVQWEPWLTVSPLDRLMLTPVFSTQQSSNKSLSTQANTKMEAVASFFFFHLVQSFYLSKVSVKYGGIRMECSVYASFSGNQVYNHVGKWCFWSSDSGLKSRLKLKCNLS